MARESQRQRLERCRREVGEHPDRALAHYNLALALTRSGQVKEAEEGYRAALDRDSTLVEAWVNLGGLLMARWDFPGCLAATQEAARLRPDLAVAHYNLGQAYLYMNDPENLLRSNLRVLELERDHPAAHYYAAVAQLALGDVPAAQRHLGRSMELGHHPTKDFLQAIEAATRRGGQQGVTLVEITGAEAPEDGSKKEKEE